MLDEARILDTLGVEMDVDLYTQTPGRRRRPRSPGWASGPGPRPATAGSRRARRSVERPERRGPIGAASLLASAGG